MTIELTLVLTLVIQKCKKFAFTFSIYVKNCYTEFFRLLSL